ncbi:DNA repair protein RecN [Exiguobacterium sp. MER 193]|uniref:DNA repair protein RecN n=1 Tax=Exiguobacterium sp. MER 193 TaxID=2939564 RepID=UPI00203AAF9C|nr:DNA repair protein RecN [Exiguobacterium sp. MER 193]MCM3278950.1 DNA repair protein RecN [Exiguobacterium sp. MER 193]
MLAELSIKQFAIIDELNIPFNRGMTVLTGETGAGKSILLDAIGLLVGGRGSSEFVRYGQDKAEIEGLFMIEPDHPVIEAAEQYGIDVEDGTVILRRDLHSSGKSVCRVNGKMMPLSTLREFGRLLVDIHGQHEHQHLMDAEFHLGILDHFAEKEIGPLVEEYQTAYAAWKQVADELKRLSQSEQELAQRMDLLSFQTKEIEAAELKVGEEQALTEERDELANFERIHQHIRLSYEAVAEESNGLDQIGVAMREMEEASQLSSSLSSVSETISNAYYLLEDAKFQLRDQLDSLEFDPIRLDEIESRLALFQQLKRKYGTTIEEVITYGEQVSDELKSMTNREEHLQTLSDELIRLEQIARDAGMRLSSARKVAAESLQHAIHRELKELYMEKTAFEVRFKTTSLKQDGLDDVEFYMMTNVGEPFKPLAKVASGGELSRVMLALKSIFSRTVGVASIIFDEVDTGVSGRVAQAMGEKIFRLSVGSQVLCITHLAQVAAMADQHLYITKTETNERTKTNVTSLGRESRIDELGRMIAGAQMTDLTKQHVEELLEMSQQVKQKFIKGVS